VRIQNSIMCLIYIYIYMYTCVFDMLSYDWLYYDMLYYDCIHAYSICGIQRAPNVFLFNID
jgi:hypothetical protein